MKNENSRKYSNAVGAAHRGRPIWEPAEGLPYVFSKFPLNPPRFRVVPTLEKGDDISPPFSKGRRGGICSAPMLHALSALRCPVAVSEGESPFHPHRGRPLSMPQEWLDGLE